MGKLVNEIANLPSYQRTNFRTRTMTDPISDMLTRIRNAVSAKHTRVDMPASRLKGEIARILQDEGYIQGFKLLDEKPGSGGHLQTLRLFLKYGPHGERLITGVDASAGPAGASTSASRTCPRCSADSARAS